MAVPPRPVDNIIEPQILQSHGSFNLTPTLLLDFGATQSDYARVDVTVDPAQVTLILEQLHAFLSSLKTRDIDINQATFIRICRTLILKRVQDLFEREKCRRAPDFVRFYTQLPVPKALFDILNALGQCYDSTTGLTYDLIPVGMDAANPQDWYTINANDLNLWIREMHRYSDVYEMCEFPSKTDFQGRALQRLAFNVNAHGLIAVKAKSSIVRPSDVLIRMMLEQLFTANAVNFNACHIVCTDYLTADVVRAQYVGSYYKRSTRV